MNDIYCPACQSMEIFPLFDMGLQPVSLVNLTDNPDVSAELTRRPISLSICRHCTHVFNHRFDSQYVSYSEAGCHMYNSGSGWLRHEAEARKMLEATLQDCDLVVEVGAGSCAFLHSLDTYAAKLAIDPSESVLNAERLDIEHCREYFDVSRHIPDDGKTLIVMRHLLEHFEWPRDILENIGARANERRSATRIFIEVPCCQNALNRARIEDWTYEHVQHFTVKSFRYLLDNCGFDRYAIVPQYNGEVICALVEIAPDTARGRDDVDVDSVRRAYCRADETIKRHAPEVFNGRVAFWGGAGKSAMFLQKFCVPDGALVIDSHREKWGMYVPGTRIKILSPGVICSDPVDTIIATTSWRATDIRDEIKTRGIQCQRLLKFENGRFVEVPLGE